MNEAMLSYYNRVRVIPYPDFTGPQSAGYDLPRYGHLPTSVVFGSGSPGYKAFRPDVFPAGALSLGWLELAGLRSLAFSGLDPNAQQLGHQQSPGNVQQTAAGRQSPLSVTMTFNYSLEIQARLWFLQPGNAAAPAYPAIDAGAAYPAAYVALAKGRLVFEFLAPDLGTLRTLGTLNVTAAQDAPDESAPMTVTAAVAGSGKAIFFQRPS